MKLERASSKFRVQMVDESSDLLTYPGRACSVAYVIQWNDRYDSEIFEPL